MAPVVAGLAAGSSLSRRRAGRRAARGARVPTWEELPPPSWRVVSRRRGSCSSRRQRMIRRGVGGPTTAAAQMTPSARGRIHTLIFENCRLRDGPAARADVCHPSSSGGCGIPSLCTPLEFEGRPVVFVQPGEASAAPNSPPAEPGLYVVEREGRLLAARGIGVARLTADTVPGIARDTLRSQSAEGGPHLSGRRGAVDPRTARRSPTLTIARGCSRVRAARDLAAEMHPAARAAAPVRARCVLPPEGWLGAELVYTAREGGLSRLNVRTGTQRSVGLASVRAVSSRISPVIHDVVG